MTPPPAPRGAGSSGPALHAPARGRRGHAWRRAGGERQPYGRAEPPRARRVTRRALAQLVASLNVVAAVLIVLMTAAAGYTWAGLVGIIVGVFVGTVFAGVVCGVLALRINIRDLLADSLTPRP